MALNRAPELCLKLIYTWIAALINVSKRRQNDHFGCILKECSFVSNA